jgi:two-component sensor histidine kinase
LKYAWPNAQQGVLAISLHKESDALLVTVRDNGIGYDPGGHHEEGSGFGLNMIKTFASKLKAEWSMENDSGTVVRLSIRNFKLAR